MMDQVRSISELVTTPQGNLLVPEGFQERLIENITSQLLSEAHPPCLLRAPTGSGKTFMLARVLGNVSMAHNVIWFWFVPYVTLVEQTRNALATNAPELSSELLNEALNLPPSANQVLLATTSSVSRASNRKAGYDAGGGESQRTLAEYAALVRANQLKIGVVVDEAHIALDEATEFGQFVQWLNPNFLAMATATPKSQRINQFLASVGKSSFESFGVSRTEVVKAKLNKAYIEAVLYQLGQTTQDVADLKATVIKQAWRRNVELKRQLQDAHISMEPLLLIQVENGEGAIEAAEEILMRECKVQPGAIGKHSADDPDPVMMSSIANDITKKVLIFKQSAGTGFDAPRAAVLASTKSVSDPDFALQFVGRVMRVSKAIRSAYPHADSIPPDLNTAYIYLANADAQAGYQAAVNSAMAVKNNLEGETEKMVMRQTKSGAQAITNRTTRQRPLSYDDLSAGKQPGSRGAHQGATSRNPPNPQGRRDNTPDSLPSGQRGGADGNQESLFGDGLDGLDIIDANDEADLPPPPQAATTLEELKERLLAHGIRVYPIRDDLPQAPESLKREDRHDDNGLARITERVAKQLTIPPALMKEAQLAARDRLKETERHIEMTSQAITTKKVRISIDRNALAAQAKKVMADLPGLEMDDRRILVEIMSRQAEPHIREALDDADQDATDSEITKMCRYAAHWIIRASKTRLMEAFWAALADHAKTVNAEPLPDAMLFPAEAPLAASDKHLYGVMPPHKDQAASPETYLSYDEQRLMDQGDWHLESGIYRTSPFDGTSALNKPELSFAEALDRAEFVSWWFRNPERKPFSVRVVRGDHANYFYPDFVVCLSHIPGDTPMQRLVETKHDLKDAKRKAMHVPEAYGPVLFLTQDGDRYYIINTDGGMGEEVDLSDLAAMRERLKETIPDPV